MLTDKDLKGAKPFKEKVTRKNLSVSGDDVVINSKGSINYTVHSFIHLACLFISTLFKISSGSHRLDLRGQGKLGTQAHFPGCPSAVTGPHPASVSPLMESPQRTEVLGQCLL